MIYEQFSMFTGGAYWSWRREFMGGRGKFLKISW